MALRGHASIQGSTDIPTLYNILPGYIPMPHADHGTTLDDFIEHESAHTGYWGHMRAYAVSLLKAWWGDAATIENDFAFGYLPRLTGDHSTYQSVLGMFDGTVKGFVVLGENPAVGSGNSRMHRLAMAQLDWLVVRDLQETETAAFWYDSPEIETGELRTSDIGTGVLVLPTDPVSGGGPHREGRIVHPDAALAAMARQGRRAHRRPALRVVVHLPPGAHHPREAGCFDRRS